MHRSELVARLADRDLPAQLAACREQLIEQHEGQQAETAEAAKNFKQEVLKGPVTRILWRRSPKE
jgi:hypothetical protein